YWAALVVAVLAIGGVYFLLRSRVGLTLTAIRDDERAARSSGVRVGMARLLVFVVAAAGCGAAGGVLAIQQLQVVPGTSGGVFSVQWTAIMAFAPIMCGLGTIEGPILRTAVYFFFQAEDGIRDLYVTGVQTCALPILNLQRPEPQSQAPTLPQVGRSVG